MAGNIPGAGWAADMASVVMHQSMGLVTRYAAGSTIINALIGAVSGATDKLIDSKGYTILHGGLTGTGSGIKKLFRSRNEAAIVFTILFGLTSPHVSEFVDTPPAFQHLLNHPMLTSSLIAAIININ